VWKTRGIYKSLSAAIGGSEDHMVTSKFLKRVIIITCFMVLFVLLITPGSAEVYMQRWDSTDLWGGDYKRVALVDADPMSCSRLCLNDVKCKGATYVKPGTVQGPDPVCLLKTAEFEYKTNLNAISFTKAEPIQLGSLDLSSSPSGASVKLDGNPVGSTPLVLRSISSGTHYVIFSMPGYESELVAAEVVAGKTATYHASLKISNKSTTPIIPGFIGIYTLAALAITMFWYRRGG
jgi:hypothetical protein